MEHELIQPGDVHSVVNWYVATAAARQSIGVQPTDFGKLCLQLDDQSVWMLANASPPAWLPMNKPDMPSGHIKGRIDGGDGGEQNLSPAQARAVLDLGTINGGTF